MVGVTQPKKKDFSNAWSELDVDSHDKTRVTVKNCAQKCKPKHCPAYGKQCE